MNRSGPTRTAAVADGRAPLIDREELAAAAAQGSITLLDAQAPGWFERERLYRAILERLAAGERPDAKWLTDKGAATEAVGRLAAADLIALEADGGIALAYPLSAHPSRHRVELDDGRQLWACCAIDALGIPAMIGVPGTVVAQTPAGEEEVRVRVGPMGEPIAEPAEAVVLAGVAGDGTTACCACPFINFFGSEVTASAYQERHREMTASLLSITNAAIAGRRLFGDLLAGPAA